MTDKPDCDICGHFYISHEPECKTPIHGPDFEAYQCGCDEYEPPLDDPQGVQP